MNGIRVQVHLKCMLDENSSSKLHSFWYAFQPSQVSTIKDLLEDIRVNYLSTQLAALGHQVDNEDERTFIVHLDDCQLLPITSSQILRDNDRLTWAALICFPAFDSLSSSRLMPLTQYKLHRKALQDTIQLNAASSTVPQEPLPPVPVSIPETNPKRQRVKSVEETIPTQSSITISSRSKPDEEQPRQKKSKVKPVEAPVIVPPPTPPVSKKPEQKAVVIQPILAPETPTSPPSTNGVLRELKSKTPAWKAEKPQNRGNPQGNSFTDTNDDDARSLIPDRGHIRFDSESDGDDDGVETTAPEPVVTEAEPPINGNHSSIAVEDPSSPVLADPAEKPAEIKAKPKKTLDLLFEMKQCKDPGEKLGKKIQQQFGRQRAQHRKRAMDYNSLANFVDHAFGLDRQELEKQISSNECQTSASSPPQVLRDLVRWSADLLLV